MEIAIEKITEHEVVKKLQRKAKVITSNKEEMYSALESVREFLNRTSIREFNSGTTHAKDMIKRMKALGFDIN